MDGGQPLCVWLVAVLVSCEEGLASKHHWETVMMRDGMRVSGRMSSGESLISDELVEVVGAGFGTDGKDQVSGRIS